MQNAVRDLGLMLHGEGLRVRYGQVTALWDVGFDVPSGEVVALVGANGAGKTTTLKALSGQLKPDAGTIRLDGAPLENRSTKICRPHNTASHRKRRAMTRSSTLLPDSGRSPTRRWSRTPWRS